MQTKVAIWLLTYNSVDFLERCINQLKNQIYTNFDVYVFDDCSTDGTQELLRAMKLPNNYHLHFNQYNLGPWKNTKFAIESLLKNKRYDAYIWWQHDDFYQPGYLAELVSNHSPEIAITHSSDAIPTHISPIINGRLKFREFKRIFKTNKMEVPDASFSMNPPQILHGLFSREVMIFLNQIKVKYFFALLKEENILVSLLINKYQMTFIHSTSRTIYRGRTIFDLNFFEILYTHKKVFIGNLFSLLQFAGSSLLRKNRVSFINWIGSYTLHKGLIFPVLKKILRILRGQSLEDLERDIRGNHLLGSLVFLAFNNLVMFLRKSLLIHKLKLIIFSNKKIKISKFLYLRQKILVYTLNQKIRKRRISQPYENLRFFSDKINCRHYLETLDIPTQHIPEKLGLFFSAEELINQFEWNHEVAITACHLRDTGLLIVKNGSRTEINVENIIGKQIVSSEYLEKIKVFEWADNVLKTTHDIGINSDCRVLDIEPKLIVEKLVFGSDNLPPRDIQLFMLNGRCRLIRVKSPISPISLDKYIDDFFPDMTPIRAQFYEPGKVYERRGNFKAPSYLPEIISLSETISSGVDFVRVDFLCTDTFFLIGELTFFPNDGVGFWNPNTIDLYLGKFL